MWKLLMGYDSSPDSSPSTAGHGVTRQLRAAPPKQNTLFDIGARTLAEVSLPGFQSIIQQLAGTKTNDVQSIAASQISLWSVTMKLFSLNRAEVSSGH